MIPYETLLYSRIYVYLEIHEKHRNFASTYSRSDLWGITEA